MAKGTDLDSVQGADTSPPPKQANKANWYQRPTPSYFHRACKLIFTLQKLGSSVRCLNEQLCKAELHPVLTRFAIWIEFRTHPGQNLTDHGLFNVKCDGATQTRYTCTVKTSRVQYVAFPCGALQAWISGRWLSCPRVQPGRTKLQTIQE